MSGNHYDFAVLGSGFGGSIMSMVLKQLGFSVLLLEKGSHPRFAIGESSTPFSNLLLERIAREYSLPSLRPLCEWGSWLKAYPELAVGLKRGFTFYHHEAGVALDWDDRRRQLLVGASPNDAVADTHWYRPEVDLFLVKQAQSAGVTYVDFFALETLSNDRFWTIEGCSSSGELNFTADFLIDASGPSSALAHHLKIDLQPLPRFPATTALYAHFRGVEKPECNTAPYPPQSAAVHHLFEGGWLWLLHFNNGVSSAGTVMTHSFAQSLGVSLGNEAVDFSKILSRFPSLNALFKNAEPTTPFFSIPQVSFRRSKMTGENWLLLPSAAGFVDPLLSTGFALNLLGILRVAKLCADGPSPSLEKLAEYERRSFEELDATFDLISALYSKLGKPEDFNLLTMLYFAALSYTESVWRLEKDFQTGFLLQNRPEFIKSREGICARVRSGEPMSREAIADAIAPFDIAGLSDWKRNNWYPADARDLLAGSGKLKATKAEIQAMLESCGLDFNTPTLRGA